MTDKTERAFELNGLKALNKELELQNLELRQRVEEQEDRIQRLEGIIRQLESELVKVKEDRDTLEHDLQCWQTDDWEG